MNLISFFNFNEISFYKKMLLLAPIYCIVFIIFFLLFLYHPLIQIRELQQNEIQEKHEYIEKYQQKVNSIQIQKIWLKINSLYAAQLAKIYQKSSLNHVLLDFAENIHSHQLQLQKIIPLTTPTTSIRKESNIPVQYFQIEALGTFSNLLSFLENLSNINWIIKISKMYLKCVNDLSNPSQNNLIQIQMLFEVYHY